MQHERSARLAHDQLYQQKERHAKDSMLDKLQVHKLKGENIALHKRLNEKTEQADAWYEELMPLKQMEEMEAREVINIII